MSGNYKYSIINELASEIEGSTKLRKQFKELLKDVAAAAHDIEWVDSGDYGEGAEDKAIRKCFRRLPIGNHSKKPKKLRKEIK